MSFRSLAFVCLALAACAPPPLPPSSTSQAIVGGTNDATDTSVVVLIYRKTTSESLCTGEVLSPHVIMTAAHCVDPAITGTGGTYTVYGGEDVNGVSESSMLAVKETHFNSAFDPNNLGGGNDVAVVIMQNPLTQAPLVMNRTALTSADDGMTVQLVGYGITSGTDSTGQTAGTRRTTNTTIASVSSKLIEFDDPNHITCEGDSGGPAFMTINGQKVIAGITSFGDAGCTSSGFDTRVDLYADSFVQPYIDQFDPQPDMAGSSGTFPPGTVGAGCNGDSDCTSGTCAHEGDTGFCTASCDPNNNMCPSGTNCGTIDNANYCVLDGRSSGCSFGGDVAGRGLALLLSPLLLALFIRRRRAI